MSIATFSSKIDGQELGVTYYTEHIVGSGFGCQGQVATYVGRFWLLGLRYGKKVSGNLGAWNNPGYHTALPKDVGLTASVVRDEVWKNVVRTIGMSGVAVFSDRVNRNSSISVGNPYSNLTLEGLPITTAAFGKWLQERPELGLCIATPYFHNPGYATVQNFGLCQLWVFFPKGRMMYADGIKLPDYSSLTKEAFIKDFIAMHPKSDELVHKSDVTHV